MRIYTVYCEASVNTARTLIEIMNGAAVSLKVLAVGISQEGSETSDQVSVELKRITGTGTGSAATPVKSEAGDPTSVVTTAKVNDSAEPTYTGDPFWSEGFNFLSGVTMQWNIMEAPTVTPGTGNGVGLKLDTAPAAATNVRAYLRYAEIG